MELELKGAGTVVIERSARAKHLRITVRPGFVRVAVPAGVPFARAAAFARSQAGWIRTHLEKMERAEEAERALLASLPPITDPREAKRKIADRFAALAKKGGFTPSGLTVRNQKTRWGSCSSTNAVSLNIQLARLPGVLMDYVILHELVHTKIRGHGGDFWRELDRYVGDAKLLRSELRRYPLIRG